MFNEFDLFINQIYTFLKLFTFFFQFFFRYMKYLYPYECEKKNLSSPQELQAAIDGNRREGRRSSYGAFGDGSMPTQLQMVSQSLFLNS